MTDPRVSAISIFNQAVAASSKDQQLSYAMFGSSVMADPTFALGWYQVGCADSDLNLLPGAVAAYRRTLEEEANFSGRAGDAEPTLVAKTLVNMGHRLYHMGRLEEAQETTLRALKLDNALSFAWCNLSMIQSVKGKTKESLFSAQKAFELSPHEPIIETALAFAYLYAGDYATGLKHFEARFPYKLQQFMSYPYPKWCGEDLTGKTLLLQADQGLGDTLSFVRFAPDLQERVGPEGRVVFMLQPELRRIVSAMLADYRAIEIMPMPQPLPVADFWTTPISLPFGLGLTTEQIRDRPNPPVPRFPMPATWKIPGRKLHVGICWAGSRGNDIEHWRRLKLEHFLDLYRVPGIQLYSLQIGESANDLHTMGCAALVRDMMPFIRDVADTVAIMDDLDLIISCETSLGHMAGAINKPHWVCYSRNGGDWRIGRTEKGSMWYPNHRIFKQGVDATWEPVIERVVAGLWEKVGG